MAAEPSGRFPDLPDPDFHFNTFLVSWGGTTSPEFRSFIEAARPEIVQVGFYGPLFHGYADNPKSTGYPMQLPVAGQREALEAQRKVNEQIHKLGLKVVAHFQMVNVIANLEKRDDFFVFYDKRWHTDILGPKPHQNVAEVLQRHAQGNLIGSKHYVDYVGLCLSSPYARQMLKQMLKVAIDAGVDGIMTNYNYRWGCACPYCQTSFKQYLAKRHTQKQLRDRFGIDDLAAHQFERIAAKIPGYPDPKVATDLDWEAMRWGALSFKEAFDEILIEYGRRLKPDLIIATWNHLGNLSIGEERAFLPAKWWGRGENYFWYSGGYGPTKLKEHKAGDGWLNCLYLREMGGGKPFMLGKYEPIRMRNSIAEGVATGGSGMGLYFNYRDPVGYEVGLRYLRFLHQHGDLYWPVESSAEVGLVLPRQSIWNRHKDSMDAFRTLGQALIDNHVLLDVVSDENLTRDRLAKYRAIVLPRAYSLSDAQCTALEGYVRQGGRLLVLGPVAVQNERREARDAPSFLGIPGAPETPLRQDVGVGRLHWLPTSDAAASLKALRELTGENLSTFRAEWTLRVSAFAQPGRLVLHFVNYNRDEEAAKAQKGPAAECPIAAKEVGVRLVLPGSAKATKVCLLSPDQDPMSDLSWEQEGIVVRFTVPSVLVYGVVEIRRSG